MGSKQNRRTVLKNIALGTSAAIAAPAMSFAKNFEKEKKLHIERQYQSFGFAGGHLVIFR